MRFVLLPGQRHATAGAALILDMALGGRIADKAFASNWIITDMNEIGAQIVISQRPRRKHPRTKPRSAAPLAGYARTKACRGSSRIDDGASDIDHGGEALVGFVAARGDAFELSDFACRHL